MYNLIFCKRWGCNTWEIEEGRLGLKFSLALQWVGGHPELNKTLFQNKQTKEHSTKGFLRLHWVLVMAKGESPFSPQNLCPLCLEAGETQCRNQLYPSASLRNLWWASYEEKNWRVTHTRKQNAAERGMKKGKKCQLVPRSGGDSTQESVSDRKPLSFLVNPYPCFHILHGLRENNQPLYYWNWSIHKTRYLYDSLNTFFGWNTVGHNSRVVYLLLGHKRVDHPGEKWVHNVFFLACMKWFYWRNKKCISVFVVICLVAVLGSIKHALPKNSLSCVSFSLLCWLWNTELLLWRERLTRFCPSLGI